MRTIALAAATWFATDAPAPEPVELALDEEEIVMRAPMVSTSAPSMRSVRSYLDDKEVIPGERQVGAEVSYLTSDAGLAGSPLRFSDLVATSLTGRASLGRRFELAGRLEALAKQPFPGGQSPFGGGTLSARFELEPRSSLYLAAGGAPLAGNPGAALEISGGWNQRTFIDRYERHVAFATAASAQGTHLFASTGSALHLVELMAGGALQVIAPDGDAGFGAEVGTALAIPVWHTGTAFWLDGTPSFDARTRVHFHLAGYFTIGPRWDLFVRWAILDRGDSTAPTSRLPLLRGGYDQSELTLGASYRFGPNVEKTR